MATGDILTLKGSKLTWRASGGSATWTPANISNGAGRLGARLDLGALTSGRAVWFDWYAENQCQATPTLNNLIRYYLALWHDDATPDDPDGDVGSSDAAYSTEAHLTQLRHIGNVVVKSAAADTIFTGSGLVHLPVRYVSLVVWNASGAALTNDNAEHRFTLDPVYEQVAA